MKFLRNLFGQLSRHWEKVLLALTLVVLIGAVIYLNQLKSGENDKIEQYNKGITRRKVNPVTTVDLSQLSATLASATNPPGLNFSPPHNLFNPVKWQRRPDGTTIKAETGKELGINAVQITKITPLNLIITLDSQAGSGAQMSATMEAATNAYYRQRFRGYVTTNSNSERIHRTSASTTARTNFILRDFRVTPEGVEADIELADGTKTTVTPGKPFMRVEGYKADLFYPPENTPFKERRVGDPIIVTSEIYNIVAINTNEVVVSARSNDRRTIIRTNAAQ